MQNRVSSSRRSNLRVNYTALYLQGICIYYVLPGSFIYIYVYVLVYLSVLSSIYFAYDIRDDKDYTFSDYA